MPTPRVDFYLAEAAGADVRLRLACRVAEKAYLAQQKVVVLLEDAESLRRFDELLWTFGDGSFVPQTEWTEPWEEFLWRGEPFGFHMRGHRLRERRDAAAEIAALRDVLELLVKAPA